MTQQKLSKHPLAHGRGRPKLGVCRLETMLPAAALNELIRREEQTGIYRTRVAAAILCRELIGETHSFNRP
jgi:hypothetical protein